jgi:protein gp37
MAENSKIEWTHHTFNPWIGCAKVSPACANCYAEIDTFARVERSKGRELWGVNSERHVTSESNWAKPLKWNRDAEKAGERHRVFCASLADVFEDREELNEPRQRLFRLIRDTPSLDWLLLTKRPENIITQTIWNAPACRMPENVWIGTTVENQEQANKRIPELLKVPAAVRFLSVEPMLGPVDLTSIQFLNDHGNMEEWDALALHGVQTGNTATIGWVICGGESGPNARPMHPDWARGLRDQCQVNDVPFFFKQWGEWADWEIAGLPKLDRSRFESHLFSERPYKDENAYVLHRVGKKAAGRLLDGREWNELPKG